MNTQIATLLCVGRWLCCLEPAIRRGNLVDDVAALIPFLQTPLPLFPSSFSQNILSLSIPWLFSSFHLAGALPLPPEIYPTRVWILRHPSATRTQRWLAAELFFTGDPFSAGMPALVIPLQVIRV